MSTTGQQYSKKSRDIKHRDASTRQNDRHVSVKAEDGSIVSVQRSLSGVALTKTANTDSKRVANLGDDLKSSSVASPQKASVKAASVSHSSNYKTSQNVVSGLSRSSPFKKQTNGCSQNRQSNGMFRVKGYDVGQATASSPHDLSAGRQTMNFSSEMVKTAGYPSDSNQRNVSRKRTTSGVAGAKNVPLSFRCKFFTILVSLRKLVMILSVKFFQIFVSDVEIFMIR